MHTNNDRTSSGEGKGVVLHDGTLVPEGVHCPCAHTPLSPLPRLVLVYP